MLRTHRGEAALQAALDSASEPVRLLQVLGPLCAVQLRVRARGCAQPGGRDRRAPGPVPRSRRAGAASCADRAAHVASDFFYAAVDEFDDRATPWRDTAPHAGPGHAEGAGTPSRLRRRRGSNDSLQVDDQARATTARRCSRATAWARALEERDLFRAMGFHAAARSWPTASSPIDRRAPAREARADVVQALEPMTVGDPGREAQRVLLDPHPYRRRGGALRRGASRAPTTRCASTRARADARDVLKGWGAGGLRGLRARAVGLHDEPGARLTAVEVVARTALPPGRPPGRAPGPASPARGSAGVVFMSSGAVQRQVHLHLLHERSRRRRQDVDLVRQVAPPPAMSWVTNRIVPSISSHSSLMRFCMPSRVCTSRAPNGSSIRMICGFTASGAGDGHALAHAARELLRVLLLRALEPHLLDPGARHALALVRGHAAQLQAERARCRARSATGTSCSSGRPCPRSGPGPLMGSPRRSASPRGRADRGRPRC